MRHFVDVCCLWKTTCNETTLAESSWKFCWFILKFFVELIPKDISYYTCPCPFDNAFLELPPMSSAYYVIHLFVSIKKIWRGNQSLYDPCGNAVGLVDLQIWLNPLIRTLIIAHYRTPCFFRRVTFMCVCDLSTRRKSNPAIRIAWQA